MASISALRRLRQRYYALRNDVQNVRSTLGFLPSDLSVAKDKVEACYLINDVPADHGVILKQKEEIASILDELSTCLSAISRRISEISEEIRRLEEAQRRRRRRL